nr:heterokaryon incompatibility protein [Colletotrichum truncatum]KAF6791447.1 heterokaryon incompatibility protein [Colletotrichum truncatum]
MYSYTRLPSERSVRLLRIIPDKNCQHGFSLSLRPYSLSNLPPFWALSYTWALPDFSDEEEHEGTQDRSFRIDCDRQSLEVGENLFNFLQRMSEEMSEKFEPSKPQENTSAFADKTRRFLIPQEGFNFWIDAICIDQKNDAERSGQVQLMSEIYQSARHVIAWLGNSEPNDNVQWVMNEFAPLMLRLWRSSASRRILQLLQDAGHELDHPVIDKLVGSRTCQRWRDSYTDFFSFFVKKRWLTRGWVVQEMAIPKPHAVILYCGRSQFRWVTINRFCTFMLTVGWEDTLNLQLGDRLPLWKKRPGTIERLWNPVSAALPEFQQRAVSKHLIDWQDRRWGATTDEEARHAEVLHNFHRLRFYEFRNPLDHIYGTLGLIPRILGPNYQSGINPSYEVSVEHAFTEVTSWLLQHLPNLDILGLAGSPDGRRQQLPSWVPDFSFHGPEQYTSLQRVRQRRMKYARWYGPLDATGTAKGLSKPFFRIEGSKLALEGTCFDTVKHIRSLECNTHGILRNVLWILEHCMRNHTYVSGGESMVEAVVKTLTADIRPRAIVQSDYSSRTEQWLRKCMMYDWHSQQGVERETWRQNIAAYAKHTADHKPFIKLDDLLQTVSLQDLEISLTDDSFTKIIHFVTPGRCFLETRGGYIGLGPAEAEVGDEIWLVKGGRMPLLLRKNRSEASDGESYSLVNEVYLHGVMHGELVNNGLLDRFHEVAVV